MPRHADITYDNIGGIHSILAGWLTNEADRLAGVVRDGATPEGRPVDLSDLGKVFQQLDSGVWYGLFSLAPLNWWVIGDGSTAVFEHGDLPGGTLHAVATTTSNGFYSSADKIANDDHRVATNNPHNTTPGQIGAIATSNPLNVTGTPSTGQVLTATSDTTATWQAPASGGVSSARQLSAGAGLTGGGDLSADRTFDVVAHADGSIVVHADSVQVGVLATDAQHGARGGGTQHALVVSGGPAGFMSGFDKAKLDAVASGATYTPLSNATPMGVGTNSPGTAAFASRSDHVHHHGDQAGGTLHAVATTSVAGFMSPSDKTKLDGIASGATNLALASTTPAAVAAAGAVGSGTTAARSDHVHAHGNQGGGPLHSEATTSVAGFMSPSDKAKLDGITSGATSTPLSNATPAAVGAAGAAGAASSASRSDHVHAHGNQAGGTLHALATVGSAGFMSAFDKQKIDGVNFFSNRFSAASGDPLPEVGEDGDYYLDLTDGDLHLHGVGVWNTLGNVRGLSDATPQPLGTASPGGSTEASRANHIHAHGDQLGGSLHATATTSVPGFMSAADKVKLDGILSNTTPAAVGSAGAVGSGTTAARADHVHAHGNQAGGSLHAVVTTSVAGFMAAADKVKLDALDATLARRMHLYHGVGGAWERAGSGWLEATSSGIQVRLFEINDFLRHGATLTTLRARVKPFEPRATGRMSLGLLVLNQDMGSVGISVTARLDDGTANVQDLVLSQANGSWASPITINTHDYIYLLAVSSGNSEAAGDQIRSLFVT